MRDEAEQASLPQEIVCDLVLAVSEACANAALHGEGPEINLRWDISPERVEIVVEDEGTFLRQLPMPEADGAGTGGRGLRLMMALVDEFTIRHGTPAEPATTVRLVKYAA